MPSRLSTPVGTSGCMYLVTFRRGPNPWGNCVSQARVGQLSLCSQVPPELSPNPRMDLWLQPCKGPSNGRCDVKGLFATVFPLCEQTILTERGAVCGSKGVAVQSAHGVCCSPVGPGRGTTPPRRNRGPQLRSVCVRCPQPSPVFAAATAAWLRGHSEWHLNHASPVRS